MRWLSCICNDICEIEVSCKHVRVLGSQSQRSIRLFSQQSRRQWTDDTLKDKNKASRTAWPVSQIEGLFLPDFPVKPEINEDHFEVNRIAE